MRMNERLGARRRPRSHLTPTRIPPVIAVVQCTGLPPATTAVMCTSLPPLTSAVSPRQRSQPARADRGPGPVPPGSLAVPRVVYRLYVERYEKGSDPAKFSKLVHFVLNFRVRVRFVDFATKKELVNERSGAAAVRRWHHGTGRSSIR